ncbi:unnamed protein product [Caenorhabditis bovis]|uniref:Uncharacterized protein n=1 Tax=Caenorhabditis bovis TaxID=2654633 RepID=A0A8S1ENN2_9PELO|nr:unnamed protein product [Caenorhabditis bovis]
MDSRISGKDFNQTKWTADLRKNASDTVEEVAGRIGEMYLHNGNYLQSKYSYSPYQYLPFPSTSTNTASDAGGVKSADVSKRFRDTSIQYSDNDTVAIAGDDLSNVPASVIIQLEKANRTIAAQNVEIERLRSFQDQNVETKLLRKQVAELEKEMRASRERFLEQEELLAEMSREMDSLLRDKMHMQASLHEIERKYKKAKMASKELARILENDMCSTSMLNGFESENEDDGGMRRSDDSLLKRSRQLSRQKEEEDLKDKCERAIEKAEQRRKNEQTAKAEKDSREMMERILIENENLVVEIERERRTAMSLQEDLEKNRRIILDRDETIVDLKEKLSKAETKAQQCETDLSRTCTDLALERARCDALTLELHELDTLFSQTHSTVQAYAIQNEQLEEKCRSANQTIISLNAKLEAQGIDLVATKKTLRAIRDSTK